MRLRRGVALALVATVVWPGAARFAAAADPSEEDLIRQGVELRRRTEDQQALDLFRRAFQMHHGPRAEAQMGLAEIALGQWEPAAQHLEEAIAAGDDAWIRKNDKALRAALAQVLNQFGSLQVLGSPDGAEIVIEGRVVGRLPLKQPIRVRVGQHRFEVRAPGYVDVSRTVTLEPRTLRRETVELSPDPRAVAAVGTDKPTAVDTGGEPHPSRARVEAESLHPMREDQRPTAGPSAGDVAPVSARGNDKDADQHHGQRVVGVVLGVLGVAGIGGGVALGLEARASGLRNSQSGNTFDAAVDSRGKAFQKWQYVGYGVGGALLLGGVVTYLLGSDEKPPRGGAPSALHLGGSAIAAGGGAGIGATLTCAGVF